MLAPRPNPQVPSQGPPLVHAYAREGANFPLPMCLRKIIVKLSLYDIAEKVGYFRIPISNITYDSLWTIWLGKLNQASGMGI